MSRRFGIFLASLCALVAGCATPSVSERALTAIVDVTVVHPERDAEQAAVAGSNVIIDGARISAVGPAQNTPVPPGAKVIDGRGRWLIPGLIDAHVHFFQSGNLYTRPDVADFNAWMPYAREVARNKARLESTFKVWLASGVTGVVDIGGPMWNFEMRDLADSSAAAPRVAVAGPLISMIDRTKLDLGDPPIIKIATPEAARALVRRQLALRPQYIKVWFIHQDGDDLAAQEAIVKAAADEAHAAGVRLAVHATELLVAKAALRAGADYLVHSVEDKPVDEEFLALARSRRVLYCPTLFVYQGYDMALSNTWKPTPAEAQYADPDILAAMHDLDKIPELLIPERVKTRMAKPPPPQTPPDALQNLRRVRDAGITVVLGTDAGNIGTLHGPSILREAQLMQQAGLSPLEILRAATTGGAAAMGLQQQIGSIASGKFADLVLLGADPLADSSNLSTVKLVFRAGRAFDPDELMRSLK